MAAVVAREPYSAPRTKLDHRLSEKGCRRWTVLGRIRALVYNACLQNKPIRLVNTVEEDRVAASPGLAKGIAEADTAPLDSVRLELRHRRAA